MSERLHPMTDMKKEKLALAYRALCGIEGIESLCDAINSNDFMDESARGVISSMQSLIHYHRLVLEYAFSEELEDLSESGFPNLWDSRFEKHLLKISSPVDNMDITG